MTVVDLRVRVCGFTIISYHTINPPTVVLLGLPLQSECTYQQNQQRWVRQVMGEYDTEGVLMPDGSRTGDAVPIDGARLRGKASK